MCDELIVFLVNDICCRSPSCAGHLVEETKKKRLSYSIHAEIYNIEMHAQSLQVSITFISQCRKQCTCAAKCYFNSVAVKRLEGPSEQSL